MKTKKTYIGLALLVIIVLIVGVIYYSSKSEQDKVYTKVKKISENKMPNDAIHKNINNLDAQKPSKENVNSNVIHKMEMFEKEFNKGVRDTVKMLEYANLLIAGHNIDKGILYYKKILKVDSKRDDILLQLAFAYTSKNDFNSAVDVTKKMLDINPNNVIALYNLGALNATIGKKDLAKTIWEELIDKFPNNDITEKAKESIKRL